MKDFYHRELREGNFYHENHREDNFYHREPLRKRSVARMFHFFTILPQRTTEKVLCGSSGFIFFTTEPESILALKYISYYFRLSGDYFISIVFLIITISSTIILMK